MPQSLFLICLQSLNHLIEVRFGAHSTFMNDLLDFSRAFFEGSDFSFLKSYSFGYSNLSITNALLLCFTMSYRLSNLLLKLPLLFLKLIF